MLIERIEFEPEYRGQGLGKEIALRVIQKFGARCGVITCVPVPLQFTGLGPNDPTPKGMRLAQQRVRGFWEGVGFVRIPASDTTSGLTDIAQPIIDEHLFFRT